VKVDGRATRTLWLSADGEALEVIDQTRLPFAFETRRLGTTAEVAQAIREMVVGALR
jgi:methylthioribose-1-phosphate isomerase